MIDIKALQTLFQKHGFYKTGKIDGDCGPMTIAAIFDYQNATPAKVPSYMYVAAHELGVSEIVGARNNERIVEYASHTELGAQNDEVAWCSSFANFCLDTSGKKGTHSAAALSWLNWGRKAPEFQTGVIAVFDHGGGHGHVTFGLWKDQNSILCLGGNQSNKVKASIFSLGQLAGQRLSL